MFNVHRARDIDLEFVQLMTYPAFRENVAGMRGELPMYRALLIGLNPDVEVLPFFHANAGEIPSWSAAAFKMALIQPSSGVAERVFSLLNNFIGDRQCKALADVQELSLMMAYNRC